jgi:hypothetical protein
MINNIVVRAKNIKRCKNMSFSVQSGCQERVYSIPRSTESG